MNTVSINQLTTLRWSFAEDAQGYARRGFQGIGIYRPKLEDFGIDRAVELLEESDLSVTSLSWAGGFTGSDGRSIDEAVADGMAAVQEAAALGAETLILIAGGRNNHIRTHARRTVCDAVRRLAIIAEEFGVRLSLEPIHRGCGSEWSFVNDLRSTLDIIEMVASPQLGLVLDTYHLMDDQIDEWLVDIAPHLDLVQLGDARHAPLGEMNRCLLGTGEVPLRPLVSRLRECGYDGPWEVELIGEDVEALSYDDLLDHTRRYLDDVLAESLPS